MRLRRAEPTDGPCISELLRQLGWSVTPDDVADELSAEPATDVVVAELDGRVAGLIALTMRRQLHRAGNVITIDTLVVDEQHRGRGIGERLVQAAFDAASNGDARAVELASNLRRVDARRFYERVGFAVAANYFVRELGPIDDTT